MNYAIITENDVSQWSDTTGEVYHFPKRYLSILQPGTKVVYYKGRLKEKGFKSKRLSVDPHYFGVGEIGELALDEKSTKEDYFGKILEFKKFSKAVNIWENNSYIEQIPEYRASNYWRDGVRLIDEKTYNRITQLAGINEKGVSIYNDENMDSPSLVSEFFEGVQIQRYSTVYERNPQAREQAVTIHGYTCMACGFNFEKTYGEWGKGFIHVHHIKPISTIGKGVRINPRTDLIVLCANCHAMVHRRKDTVLSIDDLKRLIQTSCS